MADERGGQDRRRDVTRTRMMAKRRPLWRRVLLDNLGLKIASIAIATALFALVREDKGKEVDIEVPVVLSNISEREVFVGELPRVLRVRVRDRWSKLARALERKANPYLVDLRGFTDETVYVFDRERLRQLLGVSGLSIQSVYPSEFAVRTEAKVERFVPVKPVFVGEVQDGYDIPRDATRVTPGEVRVWGAKSSVADVRELATYPIDLSKLDRDARIEVQVQKPNLPYLFVDDDRVAVEVRVIARKGRITLDSPTEVAVKNCPEDVTCHVEPPSVSVTLAGPKPVLLKVKGKQAPLEVYVDALDYDVRLFKHDGVRPNCDRPGGVDCTLAPRTVTLFLASPEQERRGPSKGR
ncbi:MAG: YbbR-like domain-containing protein [Deltaproteobacteria bacterium]|nr:YbbR-like domain-containing protein [Deltaproteobacteria bacterium]